MQYDLQCKGVLTETFILPHRFDGHMINVKDYINEEMNTHLSSTPDSYDHQHDIILSPITQWTLRTTLNPPTSVDSSTNFAEGDTEPFKFLLIDGTSDYTVVANPTTVPLSTNVVPYAFRNRIKQLYDNVSVSLSSLVIDRDVTNVFVTFYNENPVENPNATEVDKVFENLKYDIWVRISIDHPPNGELTFLLEPSDTSLANLSLHPTDATEPLPPCTFTFVPGGPLEQVHRIEIETKEVIQNESLNMRLRTIKASDNCHIVQKRFRDVLRIQDKPILSNLSWNHQSETTLESWEEMFMGDGDILHISLESDGPLDTAPTIVVEVLDHNGSVIDGSRTVITGGSEQQDSWKYTWTYHHTITSNFPSGVLRVFIDERDDYNISI